MSGAYSRNKGANYERELARLFGKAMPGATIRRGLQYRDGTECPDVTGTPFHIEAKRGRKPNVRAALQQAEHDAKDGKAPIAVIRDDRDRAFVALRLDDFLELVSDWWALLNR